VYTNLIIIIIIIKCFHSTFYMSVASQQSLIDCSSVLMQCIHLPKCKYWPFQFSYAAYFLRVISVLVPGSLKRIVDVM